MFVEVVRELADHLNDATNGVNAQLAAMSASGLFEAGDSKPADIALITDETSNLSVAQGMPPVKATGVLYSPSLSVMLAEDVNLIPPEIATSERGASIPVVIRFFIGSSATHDALRYAYYYARATLKSITGFTRLQSKSRNGVLIRNATDLRFQPIRVIEDGGSGLEWAFEITFLVRDQNP